MKHLTCMSEITHMPALRALVYTFNEDSCADVCEKFGSKGCVGCPIQEAINELYEYQKVLFDSEGHPLTCIDELKEWIQNKPKWDPRKLGFREGQLVVYQTGSMFQIGKIKALEPDGALVYYHEGSTASKTPYADLHPLTNHYCVSKIKLGREKEDNMAIARFYPGLYERFLAGHISIPSLEATAGLTLHEIYRIYPNYSLFMTIHLNQAFSDEVIADNVRAIARIPADELIATLGPDTDGTPMFYITCGDLKDKYGIEIEGEGDWD